VDIPGDAANTYATAQLFATQMTSGQSYWTDQSSSQSGLVTPYNSHYGVLTQDTNLSANNTYNFYVMLFSDAAGTSMMGYSALMTWSQLVDMGALVSGTTPDFPATTPWNAGTSVVPEPTSMALLALGMSALLLRRRRMA
jgi:hypothetical protein